jgi:hypothetical protein
VSGPIEGPRRPLPVAEIARVTRVHEESDKPRDEKKEEPRSAPVPPEHDADADPVPDAPSESGKGRNIDYCA